MEASALSASVGLARARLGLGAPLLRLRSDEQLVSLFRAGNEDAYRVIHDRYRPRILAYTRQMLASSPADAEDAVQEIFVRAYSGLRSHNRDLALRAWLYRIAHNRCVDELRRPYPLAVEAIEALGEAPNADPQALVEEREALARLIADVRRLPEQQRSALLMRELGGMPYADVSGALGVTVPAVKSLLVRARVGLAQASEARDTSCSRIREDLIVAHDRGVRSSSLARRHMRDCSDCRHFRSEVRGVSRKLGLLVPALGPLAVLAKAVGLSSFGLGGGSGAAAGSTVGASTAVSSTAAATTTTGAAAAAAGTGTAAGTGMMATVGAAATGAGHVATIIAATVVAAGAAGGAIGIQHAVSSAPAHHTARSPHVVKVASVGLAIRRPASAAQPPVAEPASEVATAAGAVRTNTSTSQTSAAPTGLTPGGGQSAATSHSIAQAHVGAADVTGYGTPVTSPVPSPPTTTLPSGTSTYPTGTSTYPTGTNPAAPPVTTVAPTSATGTTGATGVAGATPVTAGAPTGTTGATGVPGAAGTTTTAPTLTQPLTTPSTTGAGDGVPTTGTLMPASNGSGGAAVRNKTRLLVKHAGRLAVWTATGH